MLSLGDEVPDRRTLVRMVEALRHRGPHDAGIAISGPCGLGSTRLIVEQSDVPARQPMHVRHHTAEAWIVHAGHAYNFLEIQRALEASGHRFATESDTETLGRAYLQFGPAHFIKAFRGSFALAIWDALRHRLLLVRDRLGRQPLYYTQAEGWLIFGSEIKALLAHPAVPRRLNEEALPHYLACGYAPAPATLFEGLFSLPPGHMLTVDLNAQPPALHLEAYWQPPLPAEGADARSAENIATDLWAHLRWAVRQHLPAEVPVGAFLDGSLLSAALLTLLVQESPHTVQTFSLLPSLEAEEARWVRQLAAHLVTDHHEVPCPPPTPALLEALVEGYDLPFGDAEAVPFYLISRLAGEHVALAFSSTGGEALLGGEPSGDCVPPAWLTPLLGRHSHLSPADGYPLTALEGLLMRVDRCSMAASLEVRTPFADHPLVQFAAGIPRPLRDGAAPPVLLSALKGALPAPLLAEGASPTPTPVDEWLRGELAGYMQETLLGGQVVRRGLLNRDVLRRMVEAHIGGEAHLGRALWALLTLELWAQRYLP